VARNRLSLVDVLLTEYERLKEEQIHRISVRDNLIYANLLALAGVLAATIQIKSADILLLLPPVSLVLGWTYVANDEKISAVGRYINSELALRLGRTFDAPVFQWEIAHRSDSRRLSRKISQLTINIVTFVVPGLVAVAYLLGSNGRPALLVVAVAELAAIGLLAVQIVVYADIRPRRATAPGVAPPKDRV
jgi:hypothetical protein